MGIAILSGTLSNVVEVQSRLSQSNGSSSGHHALGLDDVAGGTYILVSQQKTETDTKYNQQL
jgi:hypothetical protein